jgi:hypothetical protein
MLRDIDGIAVMQRQREHGIGTPIFIISALGEIDERVRGCVREAMTTSSSHSPSRNCWHALRLLHAAAHFGPTFSFNVVTP